MVLLVDDIQHRSKWLFGRIVDVHSGSKGRVRNEQKTAPLNGLLLSCAILDILLSRTYHLLIQKNHHDVLSTLLSMV